MKLQALQTPDDADWLALRAALWPDTPEAEHLNEMAAAVSCPARFAQFLARDAHGRACGFVEAALRIDYVNGCDTSPVAFVEGLYVTPAARRQGVARALIDAVAAWATGRGCTELASDAELNHRSSHRMHLRLGFEETERVVYFRRVLPPGRAANPDPLPGVAPALRPVRLLPGDDLRRAVQALAAEFEGGSAFVVAGIGSLDDALLRLAGAVSETRVTGPLEILSLSGTVTPDGAHLHIAVADAQGRVTGGHLAYGNRVRTTAELLLAALPGWQLGRAHDPATGHAELALLRR